MSLRNKIANIITHDVDWHAERCAVWTGYAAADAILATIKADEDAKEKRIAELEAKLATATAGLVRIAEAADFYGVEANAEDQGAATLAYAHKSTCNLARTTLAELKQNQEE